MLRNRGHVGFKIDSRGRRRLLPGYAWVDGVKGRARAVPAPVKPKSKPKPKPKAKRSKGNK